MKASHEYTAKDDMKSIVLCSCLLVVGSLLVTHGAVVTLPGLGDIEGSTTHSYLLNRTIYQFRGIPYAKPPVGELRFKSPEKWDEPWNGTLDCTNFRAICPQQIGSFSHMLQEENCLHVNVYTNNLEGGGNGTGQAVMFFIHGGGFIVGSAQLYTPEYLLDEDVVLVVLQYRLGPLGFLSLKTAALPGNMGMLDMILALEWVRDNIHVFGGDANRVTLFGNSAGAAAVSLMLFSPLVEDGLMQRIIMQSGSPLANWAVDSDPVTHARGIIKQTNCSEYTDDDLIVGCLRDLPYGEILSSHLAHWYYRHSDPPRMLTAGNTVVWDEAGEKSFLRQDPAILLQEGKLRYLPMMAGTTKHEGSGFLSAAICGYIDPDKVSSGANEHRQFGVIKQIFKYMGIEDRTGYVESVLRDKYFKKNEMGNFSEMLPGLIDITGDGMFKAPVVSLASAISRRENTYLYSFNFFGNHCEENKFQGYIIQWNKGIAHEDELLYLFPQGKVLNVPEREVSRRMVQLWTSFAKNGVPEADDYPAWPPMSTSEGPYLRIDKVPTVLQSFVKEEFMSAVNDRATAPTMTANATAHISCMAADS